MSPIPRLSYLVSVAVMVAVAVRLVCGLLHNGGFGGAGYKPKRLWPLNGASRLESPTQPFRRRDT